MEVKAQTIELWPIDKPIPYANNPRNNDEAAKKLAKEMKHIGWVGNPIIVDGDDVVLAGHTRLKAAHILGLKQVPVYRSTLTGKDAQAFRLGDNKISEEAEWDIDALSKELESLEDYDLADFGFSNKDIEQALGDAADDQEAVDDGFDEEPPEEPTSKLGEIYQLGRHRLMVGDSTDVAQVTALMGGGEG